MQESLALKLPTLPPVGQSRLNVFGTGINVRCFGKGFPWMRRHYTRWSEGAALVLPYLDQYGIGQAIVPDFRGMNAYLSDTDEHELIDMHHPPQRLRRTVRSVDGSMLQLKQSALSITADCHTVLLMDTLHRKACVLHCGRDALQPIRRDGSKRCGEASIVDAAMRRLMPTSPREVYALILCGIGPDSYENRADWDSNGFHQAVVNYFATTCGRGVVQGPVETGFLNIPLIIRTQLGKWGVGLDNPGTIVWDGIDTYDDRSGFYSRRKGAEGNNCIMIDMEHAFQ